MRVLILTQWYPPEPALLLQDLAKELQARGHEVTVLTGFPNYPSGELYPGYRVKLIQREVLDGVPVVRVPLYPDHSRSAPRRVLNYISFALASTLLGPWVAKRPDIIFVFHPPLTVGLPAVFLSRFWRVPFVYQVQDLWPETLSATGMVDSPSALRWVGQFAKWVYGRASEILVISPGFRRNLLDKGVPSSKVHFVSNWVDSSLYYPADPDPRLAEELGLADRFNVMFAGNVGEAQGLETVVEAAELLLDLPQVQFVIVGDGTALPNIKQAAEARGLTNVRFLGRRPPSSMSQLYALADVLLVHLKNDPLFRITIPHKTLSYLGTGKPVLAAIEGDTAGIIGGAGAGMVCAPSDPGALAATVREFYSLPSSTLQDMRDAALAAVQDKYSRTACISQIEAIMLGAAHDRREVA